MLIITQPQLPIFHESKWVISAEWKTVKKEKVIFNEEKVIFNDFWQSNILYPHITETFVSNLPTAVAKLRMEDDLFFRPEAKSTRLWQWKVTLTSISPRYLLSAALVGLLLSCTHLGDKKKIR